MQRLPAERTPAGPWRPPARGPPSRVRPRVLPERARASLQPCPALALPHLPLPPPTAADTPCGAAARYRFPYERHVCSKRCQQKGLQATGRDARTARATLPPGQGLALQRLPPVFGSGAPPRGETGGCFFLGSCPPSPPGTSRPPPWRNLRVRKRQTLAAPCRPRCRWAGRLASMPAVRRRALRREGRGGGLSDSDVS